MIEVVEKIDFSLPDIAEFNIPDGLDAVRDALRRSVANKQVESVTIQLSDA